MEGEFGGSVWITAHPEVDPKTGINVRVADNPGATTAEYPRAFRR